MATREQCVKSISGSLRYERREHGYTQESLAKATGFNASTINSWEGLGGSIGLVEAWQIADLYGISLDQLAGRSE